MNWLFLTLPLAWFLFGLIAYTLFVMDGRVKRSWKAAAIFGCLGLLVIPATWNWPKASPKDEADRRRA